VEWAAGEVRGEITVVVAGADAAARRAASGLADESGWVAAVRQQEADGMGRREAIADVAQRAGIPRRDVYEAVVRVKAPRP
jgi:16S rRNA (cytidine1402-2'-O)-methyltransferase